MPLARRNLFTEKVRFAMSVAGVAFAVLLVLVVASLYRGWSASSTFFERLPGDVWVAQAGTSDPMRSSSALPADGLAAVSRIDGVALAMPAFSRRIAVPVGEGELSVQFMSFVAPSGLPLSTDERARFLPAPGTVAIDGVFADEAGVEVGSELTVVGRRFEVAHIEAGGNPLFALAFLNGSDADGLLSVDDYVSFFVLVLRPDANTTDVTADVIAAVPDALPGAEARTTAEYADVMSATVDKGFLPVVGALVAIGLAIGGAVVALTTYTATIEKARDFAVMKALGASAWFVYRVVIRQSVLVGVAGSVLGVIAAALVATFIRRVVPEFVTDLRFGDTLAVVALTVVISFVAAYVPVRRINRIDPATVFRA